MDRETNRLAVVQPMTRYDWVYPYKSPRLLTFNGSVKLMGHYKGINGSIEGSFVPGIFRVNPVDIREVRTNCSEGYYFLQSLTDSKYFIEVSGPWMGYAANVPKPNPLEIRPAWSSNRATSALQKAYSKLSETQFDAGVALAELKETVEFLRAPIHPILRYLKKPRYRNFTQGTKDFANMSTSTWMSFRYGLMPLLMDLRDAIEAFRKGLVGINSNLRCKRASVSFDLASSSVLRKVGITSLTVDVVRSYEGTDKYHAGVFYTLKSDWGDYLLSQLGLSPWDIPGIVWEKVPLSFVVDWFVNVGRLLSAIRPRFYVTVLGNYVSRKCDITLQWAPANPQPSSGFGIREFTDSTIEITEKSLTRVTNLALPQIPAVNFEYREFLHVLDSLCLLYQRLTPLFTALRRVRR